MEIKGLIFDFDGLILDTELPIFQAWQEIYRVYDLELPLSEWSKAIGSSYAAFNPAIYLEELTGQKFNHEQLHLAGKKRALDMTLKLDVRPGVRDYLDSAQQLGLKLGLASSSNHTWIYDHLTRLGLFSFFDAICTGDQVPHIKPEPDLYQCTLSKLGLTPAEAMAFEDSPNGITAAKAAGLYCVAVPNSLTGQLDINHADKVIKSMSAMPLKHLLEQV